MFQAPGDDTGIRVVSNGIDSPASEFLGQPPVSAAVVQNGIGTLRRDEVRHWQVEEFVQSPWVNGSAELVEPRQFWQGDVGQRLGHEAPEVGAEWEPVREIRPATHLLELGLIPRHDVCAVVDELQPGGRHQQVVRVDVAAGYPRLTGLPEQDQQAVKVASVVLRSLLVRVHRDNALTLLSDLQQVRQRPVTGDLAYQRFQEGNPLQPIPCLPVMEILVDQPSIGEDYSLLTYAEAG